MFRQVFVPTKEVHNVEVPAQFFGKTVECILFEIEENEKHDAHLKTQKHSLKKLAGAFPKFPSLAEIREENWRDKW